MIQGESSATLILGSFHLNCCKERFFHDKQIASVPRQRWGGHGHPLPARGPESSSSQGWGGGAGMAEPWDGAGEVLGAASHATGEFSPGAAGIT